MFVNLQHYIGHTVEIIYQDQEERISQRRIRIKEIQNGVVKAYCLRERSPRIFRIENILAVIPVKGKRTS